MFSPVPGLNHFENLYEQTQVWRVKSPFTIPHRWWKMGGHVQNEGGGLCSGPQRPKRFAQVGCPSGLTIGVSRWRGGGADLGSGPTHKPP